MWSLITLLLLPIKAIFFTAFAITSGFAPENSPIWKLCKAPTTLNWVTHYLLKWTVVMVLADGPYPIKEGSTFLAWDTVIRGQRKKEDPWFDFDHGDGCVLIWSVLFCSVLCIDLLVFESLKCCLILMSVRKVPPSDYVAGAPITHPRQTKRYRESYYGWWCPRNSSSRKCQVRIRTQKNHVWNGHACSLWDWYVHRAHMVAHKGHILPTYVSISQRGIYAQLTSYFSYNAYSCTIWLYEQFLKNYTHVSLTNSIYT